MMQNFDNRKSEQSAAGSDRSKNVVPVSAFLNPDLTNISNGPPLENAVQPDTSLSAAPAQSSPVTQDPSQVRTFGSMFRDFSNSLWGELTFYGVSSCLIAAGSLAAGVTGFFLAGETTAFVGSMGAVALGMGAMTWAHEKLEKRGYFVVDLSNSVWL